MWGNPQRQPLFYPAKCKTLLEICVTVFCRLLAVTIPLSSGFEDYFTHLYSWAGNIHYIVNHHISLSSLRHWLWRQVWPPLQTRAHSFFRVLFKAPCLESGWTLYCVRKGKENEDGKCCVLESGSSVSHLWSHGSEPWLTLLVPGASSPVGCWMVEVSEPGLVLLFFTPAHCKLSKLTRWKPKVCGSFKWFRTGKCHLTLLPLIPEYHISSLSTLGNTVEVSWSLGGPQMNITLNQSHKITIDSKSHGAFLPSRGHLTSGPGSGVVRIEEAYPCPSWPQSILGSQLIPKPF